MKNKFLSALVIVAISMCLVGCVSFGPVGSSALSQFIGAQTSGISIVYAESASFSGKLRIASDKSNRPLVGKVIDRRLLQPENR